MFTVNGKELEYDVFDADKMEAFESAMEKVSREMEALEQEKDSLSASRSIRRQCGTVAECFDSLFGPGTAVDLFNGRVNLKLALQSFGELVKGIEEQSGEVKELSRNIRATSKSRARSTKKAAK